MGRRKIQIKPIKEDRNRYVTFIKRKAGLFKKAHELAVLCQVDLALVIVTPEGKVFEYSTSPTPADIFKKRQSLALVEHKRPSDYGFSSGQNSADEDEDLDEEDMSEQERSRGPHTSSGKTETPPANSTSIMAHKRNPSAGGKHGYVDHQASRPKLKVQIPVSATPDQAKSRPNLVPGQGTETQVPATEPAGDGAPGPDSTSVGNATPSSSAAAIVQLAPSGGAQGTSPTASVPLNMNVSLDQRGQPMMPQQFNQRGQPVPAYFGQRQLNLGNPQLQAHLGHQNFYGHGFPMPYNYGPNYTHPPSAGGPNMNTHSQHPGAPPPLSGIAGGMPSSGVPSGVPGGMPGGAAGAASNPGALNQSGMPPHGQIPGGMSGQPSAGGRWSGPPQSPMAYFVPAGDQSKMEPGPLSAAIPSRYMNEMLSPSNYFSMEWGVWDPQASAVPGGTARVVPPLSAHQGSDIKKNSATSSSPVKPDETASGTGKGESEFATAENKRRKR